MPFEQETVGEPYTGNPYVRFDEGVLNAARPDMVCGSRVRRSIRSCVPGNISILLYRNLWIFLNSIIQVLNSLPAFTMTGFPAA
jgi:hypothetical protein